MQNQRFVTVTFTPKEQGLLLASLESFQHLDTTKYDAVILSHLWGLISLHKKLHLHFIQSGDLCRSSVQSSDVVGQGGTNITEGSIYDFDAFPDHGGTMPCHVCDGQGHYSKINPSEPLECEFCCGTGIRLADPVGQGGN